MTAPPLPLQGLVAADFRTPQGEVGMRVQAGVLGATPLQLRQLGEAAAAARLSATEPKVWAWVYGADMDLRGPAVCVSYVDMGSTGPVTEFTDPRLLVLWYQGGGATTPAAEA